MSFDEPPVRRRADQPGEEFPDTRRYHDWSDIESPRDAPQPAQEPPKPTLRVLPPPPEPDEAPEAVLGAPEESSPPDPVIGLRLYAKQLRQMFSDALDRERSDE